MSAIQNHQPAIGREAILQSVVAMLDQAEQCGRETRLVQHHEGGATLVFGEPPERTGIGALTSRQAEIAASAAMGLTDKEIAVKTGLSPMTVKMTLKNIYKKMGLNRRTQLVQFFPPQKVPDVDRRFPKRELEVLAEVAKGAGSKEIGNALGISEATVKVHLKYAFARIGVRNRTEAAVWWRSYVAKHGAPSPQPAEA